MFKYAKRRKKKQTIHCQFLYTMNRNEKNLAVFDEKKTIIEMVCGNNISAPICKIARAQIFV